MSKLKVDEIRSADRSVSSSANITLADGGNVNFAENLVIANGKGIDFSAVSGSASGSSSALLDDYEEGTWTPFLKTSSNGNANTTYHTGTGDTYGRYQKVGNVCHAQFKLHINAIGNAAPGKLWGLPFTSANLSTVQTGVCSYFAALATAQAWLAWYIENNATTAYFVGTSAGSSGTSGYSASTTVNNGVNVFGNGTTVYGAISYFTE